MKARDSQPSYHVVIRLVLSFTRTTGGVRCHLIVPPSSYFPSAFHWSLTTQVVFPRDASRSSIALTALVNTTNWLMNAAVYAVTLSMDAPLFGTGGNFYMAVQQHDAVVNMVQQDHDGMGHHGLKGLLQAKGFKESSSALYEWPIADQICSFSALFAPLIQTEEMMREFLRHVGAFNDIYGAASLQAEMERLAAALAPFVRADPLAELMQAAFATELKEVVEDLDKGDIPFFFDLEQSAGAAEKWGGALAPGFPMIGMMVARSAGVLRQLEALASLPEVMGILPCGWGSESEVAKNCKVLNKAGTRCERCKNRHFLDVEYGVCKELCPTGMIPFGDLSAATSVGFVCLPGSQAVCSKSQGCTCFGLGKCAICSSDGHRQTCLECAAGFYLIPTKSGNYVCVKDIKCRGSTFVKFADRPCSCAALDNGNCFACKLTGGGFDGGNTTKCVVCQNSRYQTPEGRCVQATDCPAGSIPALTGAKGRRCVSEPFICKNGKDTAGRICNCIGTCNFCYWSDQGHLCLGCGGGTYLMAESGTCVAKCPREMAHVSRGTFNRFCSHMSIDCSRGKEHNSGSARPCKCPKGCRACTYATDNEPLVASCSKCKRGHAAADSSGICIPQ